MDGTTHFIKNIIYCRDPTIIDPETMHTNQRNAFSHENTLDVKKMMTKRRDYLHDDAMNYRMAALNRSPMVARQRQQVKPTKAKTMDAQVYTLTDESDKTLLFESRFESGNLYLAQKVTDSEYNLLMQNDVNTQGHTQWFFFRVTNTTAGKRVKFNLLNYTKPDSLFNYGMKVTIYSERAAEEKKTGWYKGGDDIAYFQNGIRKDVVYSSKSFYTATFTYKFKYTGDKVYFAYSQPYTYTDLKADLQAIEQDPERGQFVTNKVLCQTLQGTHCEYLTITTKGNKDSTVPEISQRKGVIISARVHPGETVGSHMMKGVLEFLTDPLNKEAKLLRDNFVFKVIPMLNPDGVINGNYRCSLAGCDLNRRWKAPSKVLHPTIYYTKKLVKQVHEEREVVMFCDLHGHSRKQNVFMYGCSVKSNPGVFRVVPYLLSQLNPYFNFDYSRFGVQKSKEATARIALFRELKNVPCIYTMESSFAGLDFGKAKGTHFTVEMLMTLGRDVCRTMLAYQNIYIPEELRSLPMFKRLLTAESNGIPSTPAVQKKLGHNTQGPSTVMNAILQEFKDNKDLIENGDGDSSSGSDDAPSEDNLEVEDLARQLPPDKGLKQEVKKAIKVKEEIKIEKAKQAVIPPPVVVKPKPVPPPEVKRLDLVVSTKPVLPFQKQKEVLTSNENKQPEKKKVEMRDAWTQTEKSATAEYKAKLARERARQALTQAQATTAGQVYELQKNAKNVMFESLQNTPNPSKETKKHQMPNTVNQALTPQYSAMKNSSQKPQSGGEISHFNPNGTGYLGSPVLNQPPGAVQTYQQIKYNLSSRERQTQQQYNSVRHQNANGFFSLNGFNKRTNQQAGSTGPQPSGHNSLALNQIQRQNNESKQGHPSQQTQRRESQPPGQRVLEPGFGLGQTQVLNQRGQNAMPGINVNAQMKQYRTQNQASSLGMMNGNQSYTTAGIGSGLGAKTQNIAVTEQTLEVKKQSQLIVQNPNYRPNLANQTNFGGFSGQKPPSDQKQKNFSPHVSNNVSPFQPPPATSAMGKFNEKNKDTEGQKAQDQSYNVKSHFSSFSDPQSKNKGMTLQGNSVSSPQKYEPVLTKPSIRGPEVRQESPLEYAQNFKEQVCRQHLTSTLANKPISTQQFQMQIGGNSTTNEGVQQSINQRNRGLIQQDATKTLAHSSQQQYPTPRVIGPGGNAGSSQNSQKNLATTVQINPNAHHLNKIAPSENNGFQSPNIKQSPNINNYRQKMKQGNLAPSPINQRQKQIAQLKQAHADQVQNPSRTSHPQRQMNKQQWTPVLDSQNQEEQDQKMNISRMRSDAPHQGNIEQSNLQEEGGNRASSLNNQAYRQSNTNLNSDKNCKFHVSPQKLSSTQIIGANTILPVLGTRHQPKDNSSSRQQLHGPQSMLSIQGQTQLQQTFDIMNVVPNTATLVINDSGQLHQTISKRKSANHFDAQPKPIRSNSNVGNIAFQAGLETSSAPNTGHGEGVKPLTSVDIVQLTRYEEAVLNSPRQNQNLSRNLRNGNQSSEKSIKGQVKVAGQTQAIKQNSQNLPYPTVREAATAERAQSSPERQGREK